VPHNKNHLPSDDVAVSPFALILKKALQAGGILPSRAESLAKQNKGKKKPAIKSKRGKKGK
jgi:hypothetical protein